MEVIQSPAFPEHEESFVLGKHWIAEWTEVVSA